MSYYTGDIPAQQLVVAPVRDGEPIDLAPFTSATATLRDDTGSLVASVALTATLSQSDDTVHVSWPTTSPFTTSGVYYVGVVLLATGKRERVLPVPVIVEDEYDGWLALEAARILWADAPDNDLALYQILWTAQQQVIAYAPALTAGQLVPKNYKAGQEMQARNIWNASKAAPDTGGLGEDSFAIVPRPLDWMVKQMLRPHDAVPKVG